MEGFKSQKYRDDLATQLMLARSKGENAQNILSTEKESVLYKVSEIIKRLKGGLPKEYDEYIRGFKESTDSEQVLENFDVEDISDRITLEHRLFIEAETMEDFAIHFYDREEFPQSIYKDIGEIRALLFPTDTGTEQWGIEAGPDLYNEITEGEFFDNRNLNHVVLGQKTGKNLTPLLVKPFDFDSGMMSVGEDTKPLSKILFLGAGYNGYACQLSKPLLILKPTDLKARKFVENSHSYKDTEQLIKEAEVYKRNISFERDEKGKLGYRTGDYNSPLHNLLFLAGYPLLEQPDVGIAMDFRDFRNKPVAEYKWSDVATEMVNLRAGKLYKRKQSEDEVSLAEEGVEFYRDLLRTRFNIDYERDMEVFRQDNTSA
jgi:hypothetical protein